MRCRRPVFFLATLTLAGFIVDSEAKAANNANAGNKAKTSSNNKAQAIEDAKKAAARASNNAKEAGNKASGNNKAQAIKKPKKAGAAQASNNAKAGNAAASSSNKAQAIKDAKKAAAQASNNVKAAASSSNKAQAIKDAKKAAAQASSNPKLSTADGGNKKQNVPRQAQATKISTKPQANAGNAKGNNAQNANNAKAAKIKQDKARAREEQLAQAANNKARKAEAANAAKANKAQDNNVGNVPKGNQAQNAKNTQKAKAANNAAKKAEAKASAKTNEARDKSGNAQKANAANNNNNKAQAANAAKKAQAAKAANSNNAQTNGSGAKIRQTASAPNNGGENKGQAVNTVKKDQSGAGINNGNKGTTVGTNKGKKKEGSVPNAKIPVGGSTINLDGDQASKAGNRKEQNEAGIVEDAQGGTVHRTNVPETPISGANVMLQGALRHATKAVEAASAASGLDVKLREIGEIPLVASSVNAVKETITVAQKGVASFSESSVGKMAGDMATRASGSAGDAAARMMDAVGESTKDMAASVRVKIDEKLGFDAQTAAASGLDAKLREIGEIPLVASSVKAVKETITVAQKGVASFSESSVGKMAGDMATRASGSAGDAAARMMDAVGESTKDMAESVRVKIDEKLGPDAPTISASDDERHFFTALLAAAAIAFVFGFILNKVRCRRRRGAYYGKKVKIDERVDDWAQLEEGSGHSIHTADVSDVSGSQILKQPFQLYNEFEYTMRKRNNHRDSKPVLRSTARSLSFGCDDNSFEITGKGKVWLPKKNTTQPNWRRKVLMGMSGAAVMGVVAGVAMMPRDMSFGELYLVTAEYVNRLIMGGDAYVL